MKTLIVTVVLLLGAASAGAQVSDSCLDLYQNVFNDSSQRLDYWNPDSVMVDTCGEYNKYGEMYAKRYFLIQFYNPLIHLDSVREDSVLTVPWWEIDSSYSDIRTIFQKIALRYGGAWLTKLYPNIGDSNSEGYNLFKLSVGMYAPADTILSTLPRAPWIEYVDFTSRPVPLLRNVKPTLATTDSLKLVYATNGNLYISGLTHNVLYELYDEQGRCIASDQIEPGNEIDLSHLLEGVYFFRIRGGSGRFFKFIHIAE